MCVCLINTTEIPALVRDAQALLAFLYSCAPNHIIIVCMLLNSQDFNSLEYSNKQVVSEFIYLEFFLSV